ncbi:2'-5' RNA ligase family protein [Streptomyces sp. BI20]|uniref:2'-5' RNA ligase family protein n=1 Tax=Streptomyces sp. BI20 TaxID=3403460 RepID=UPI003C70E97A
MGTVTLGVALPVPEPHGSTLRRCRIDFGDDAAHHIPTHVTLLPPTAVDADRLPEIRTHLEGVASAFRPFVLRLSGTGTFRPLSPVVFVTLAEGAPACGRLQERVRDPRGPLVRELAFPYHPHVTVAHGISEAAMDRAHAELSGFEAAWLCTGLSLYEQGLDGVWRKLTEYPFGSGPIGSGAGARVLPAQQTGSPVDEAVTPRS